MTRPTSWIVRVDLSTGAVERMVVSAELQEAYLGGPGVGWRLMADALAPGIDPLSPENVICINPGVLVGTLTPGTPKTTVITKFPTEASEDGKHFVGSCTAGGRFLGIALKRAGCHHLLITGKAPRPSYLRIRDESIQHRLRRPLPPDACPVEEVGQQTRTGRRVRHLRMELEANEASVHGLGGRDLTPGMVESAYNDLFEGKDDPKMRYLGLRE